MRASFVRARRKDLQASSIVLAVARLPFGTKPGRTCDCGVIYPRSIQRTARVQLGDEQYFASTAGTPGEEEPGPPPPAPGELELVDLLSAFQRDHGIAGRQLLPGPVAENPQPLTDLRLKLLVLQRADRVGDFTPSFLITIKEYLAAWGHGSSLGIYGFPYLYGRGAL